MRLSSIVPGVAYDSPGLTDLMPHNAGDHARGSLVEQVPRTQKKCLSDRKDRKSLAVQARTNVFVADRFHV